MAEQTIITGIEHGRATFAYAKAEEGSRLKGNTSKEYKAYTKRIPMLIKTNGLGAALAFIKAKGSGNDAYQLLYEQTAQWLQQDDKSLVCLAQDDDLVGKIVSLNSPEYRAVTTEVLALFSWLRRFAEGLIEGEADGND
jgi:CRISPR-associated protein Cmr5